MSVNSQAGTDCSRRTALVTGSSNGIGEAIVKELAKLDYKLIVTGRDANDIARVAGDCASLSPSGLRPLEIKANLEFDEDVERLFNLSLDHFSQRLDLLVNNAGIPGNSPPNSDQRTVYAIFKRTQQVNLNSAVYLTLLARPALEATAKSHCNGLPTSIINISSTAAIRTMPDYAYCTSKAAMSHFSNCFSAELAPLVRVNCITPGPVETKIFERSGYSLEAFKTAVNERLTPMRRIGQPEEVAHAVAFLADPERAGYISGAQLNVDGATAWAHVIF